MNHFKIFSFMFKGRKIHVQKYAINQILLFATFLVGRGLRFGAAVVREVVLTIALPRPPTQSWWGRG